MHCGLLKPEVFLFSETALALRSQYHSRRVWLATKESKYENGAREISLREKGLSVVITFYIRVNLFIYSLKSFGKQEPCDE